MIDAQTQTGDEDELSAADMRASHGDRDQVVEILRDAAGDGRLTVEELDERVEAALGARTMGELARLTRDLPVSPEPSDPGRRSKDVVEINQRFGTLHRSGEWEVPRRLELKMAGGDVKLDFTDAVLRQDTLDLHVDIGAAGNLILVVRPGVVVDTDGLKVRGDVKVRAPNSGADGPVVLRVTATGRLRGGDVVVRYPRRTLGQWVRGESAI
jgi:hypothetical protein